MQIWKNKKRTMQEAVKMDLGSIPNKALNFAEKNAMLLSFVGTGLGRISEENIPDPLGNYIRFYTFGYPGVTPLTEIQGIVKDPLNGLKWKLWNAPHINTQVFKISAIAYVLGKYLGLFGGKWLEISKNIAIGAGASAILQPSSGPTSSTLGQSPNNGNRGYTY